MNFSGRSIKILRNFSFPCASDRLKSNISSNRWLSSVTIASIQETKSTREIKSDIPSEAAPSSSSISNVESIGESITADDIINHSSSVKEIFELNGYFSLGYSPSSWLESLMITLYDLPLGFFSSWPAIIIATSAFIPSISYISSRYFWKRSISKNARLQREAKSEGSASQGRDDKESQNKSLFNFLGACMDEELEVILKSKHPSFWAKTLISKFPLAHRNVLHMRETMVALSGNRKKKKINALQEEIEEEKLSRDWDSYFSWLRRNRNSLRAAYELNMPFFSTWSMYSEVVQKMGMFMGLYASNHLFENLRKAGQTGLLNESMYGEQVAMLGQFNSMSVALTLAPYLYYRYRNPIYFQNANKKTSAVRDTSDLQALTVYNQLGSPLTYSKFESVVRPPKPLMDPSKFLWDIGFIVSASYFVNELTIGGGLWLSSFAFTDWLLTGRILAKFQNKWVNSRNNGKKITENVEKYHEKSPIEHFSIIHQKMDHEDYSEGSIKDHLKSVSRDVSAAKVGAVSPVILSAPSLFQLLLTTGNRLK